MTKFDTAVRYPFSGLPPKILYTFPIPILSLWPSLDLQLGETDHNDTQVVA